MRDAVFEVLHGCQIGINPYCFCYSRAIPRFCIIYPSTPQLYYNHTTFATFCSVRSVLLPTNVSINISIINRTAHSFLSNITNASPLQTGRVSPRTSTRGGDAGSKASQHSTSPQHSSPLANEIQNKPSLSNTPNLNPAPTVNSVDGKGKAPLQGKDVDANVVMTGTAVTGSLGGRTTAESMPVHKPSQGFRKGGERAITKIDEEGGGTGAS
jgi:hypothetical protein